VQDSLTVISVCAEEGMPLTFTVFFSFFFFNLDH
jgi:hypothetical protein